VFLFLVALHRSTIATKVTKITNSKEDTGVTTQEPTPIIPVVSTQELVIGHFVAKKVGTTSKGEEIGATTQEPIPTSLEVDTQESTSKDYG
jgi:hypothetical protein